MPFEETGEADPVEVMRELGATYPCMPRADWMASACGVTQRPARIVIDADGKIAALLFEPEADLAGRLRKVLEPLLAR